MYSKDSLKIVDNKTYMKVLSNFKTAVSRTEKATISSKKQIKKVLKIQSKELKMKTNLWKSNKRKQRQVSEKIIILKKIVLKRIFNI